LRDIATIMLETGMRPEEVYRIEHKNVDFKESRVFIPFGKTKAARRWLSLSETAKEVLSARMGGESSYLFPCATDSSKPIPKVNNAHDRAVRDSKVDAFRLYDLRHTFATRAAQSGMDIVALAAILGHSRIQMVMRYAHPTQEHQTQAMRKVAIYTSEQKILHAQQSASPVSNAIQ
jgi:integrase